jgi:CRP/FNR family transcriptional regulator, cyclic AMP receptor protein
MNNDSRFWYLRNHNIFSEISDNTLKELCVIVGFKKISKNAIIDLSEERYKRLFFLKKGIIKIVQCGQDGREQTVDLIGQGDIFGETASDNPLLINQKAIAVTEEVIICTFPVSKFERMLEKHASISVRIFNRLNAKIEYMRSMYLNMIEKDTRTRLLEFLSRYGETFGEKGDDCITVRNYLTHQDIANLICSKRQTVCTLLKELKEDNRIDYSKSCFTIYLHDREL